MTSVILLNFLPYLSAVIGICVTIGGFFAVRTGKQTQLTKFQKDTIDAFQQRVELLEGKIAEFEKENVVQRHIFDTIVSALKQRGMIITVDGDMVTIQDQAGASTHRKRNNTPKPPVTPQP